MSGGKDRGAAQRTALILGSSAALFFGALATTLGLLAHELSTRSLREQRQLAVASQELSDDDASIDAVRQGTVSLALAASKVRETIGLPPDVYPALEPPPALRQQGSTAQEILLNGLDTVISDRDDATSETMYRELEASPFLSRSVARGPFTTVGDGKTSLRLARNGRTYFTIVIDPESRLFRTTDFFGSELRGATLDGRFESFVNRETPKLAAHFSVLAKAEGSFTATLRDPEVTAFLDTRQVSVSQPIEYGSLYVSTLMRGPEAIGRASLDERKLTVRAGERTYGSVEEFAQSFPRTIESLDLRTPLERRIDESKSDLSQLAHDRSFMSLLSSRGVTMSARPREDDFFVHYDFLDADSRRIGSFSVAKGPGSIFILDPDDVSIREIQLSQPPTDRLPEGEAPTGAAANAPLDIVICGEHQGDTDSMMIAHTDPVDNRIILISLPRDLYYKGRKINSIYETYGPDELMKEISDITGLSIANYVVVDQYAFIDLINLIGGIDLYLAGDLVDPTYRVRDDGVWSTLHYAKGWHHLTGVEALRIARSRHSTSDFVRALRQQEMLGDIRAKLAEGGPSDLGKLFGFVQVVSRYVTTNFTPVEMYRFYQKYRDSQLSSQHILDTRNVLYNTYSNLLDRSDEAMRESDFNLGAWILLPKNNDWNLIKWYIHRIVDGEAS